MSSESDHSGQDDSLYVNNMCENDEELFHNLKVDSGEAILQASPDMYEYYTNTPSDILPMMLSAVHDITDLLACDGTTGRLLMNHYKWSKMDLINDFVDSDLTTMLDRAKIPVPNDKKCAEEEAFECGICYATATNGNGDGDGDGPVSLLGSNNCGHLFCTACWTQYLNTKIFEDDCGEMLLCAAYECNALLDDTMVLNLITEKRIKDKFEVAILSSFVQCNPRMRWCPAADCTHVIRVEQKSIKPVTCECGQQFCFGCGEFNHQPIECALLKRWTSTVRDDVDTAMWLNQHSKKCPKCNAYIEKNGGCNHMTCFKCKNEFCWICFCSWTARHACNQYQGSTMSDDKIDLISPERYKHYMERYENHIRSLKFESHFHSKIEARMAHLQEVECLTHNEVLFLRRAAEILCKSRQILTATYVFAYFTRKCNQLFIFEDNQRDLEIATEELSSYLEHEMTGDSFMRTKQALQEKAAYCEQRQKVLLGHVCEGYEQNWWHTLEPV